MLRDRFPVGHAFDIGISYRIHTFINDNDCDTDDGSFLINTVEIPLSSLQFLFSLLLFFQFPVFIFFGCDCLKLKKKQEKEKKKKRKKITKPMKISRRNVFDAPLSLSAMPTTSCLQLD